MAKTKTIFVCSECGYESSKWLGKCPSCGTWNSFYEEKEVATSSKASKNKSDTKPQALNTFEGKEAIRCDTGFEEVNRTLGGGLVKGSLILLGGEPGIGKSTLVLQLCNNMAKEGKILYVSGEESAEQVKLRADRLNISDDNIMFYGETDINAIEENVINMEPKLVIIDSIQTMFAPELSSAPGTVSQVRDITARLLRCCKQNGITTIIIGHVTKDGNIAGPRVLEHMVDTVLYLEGERYFSYRILRAAKNRFGSTNEVGMFEMANEGMVEVKDPSDILLSSESSEKYAGACVTATIEGSRALLLELQALTTTSVYGMPKRTATGIDFNRLAMLIAVLEKRGHMSLGSQDVYLNVASGMKIGEPAADLAIALVVASCYKDTYIPKDTAIVGELGLTGEVRSVNLIDKRLNEMERLGIKKAIIPQNNKKLLKNSYDLDIIGVRNINEALKAIGIK